MKHRVFLPLVALLVVLATPASLANPLPYNLDELEAEEPPPKPVPDIETRGARNLDLPVVEVLADMPLADIAPPEAPASERKSRILWLAGGGMGALLFGAWLLYARGRREDDGE